MNDYIEPDVGSTSYIDSPDRENDKKLLRKGRIQGVIITVIAVTLIVIAVALERLLAGLFSGNFSASLLYGTTKNSLITHETEKKLDVLQAIIERYYLEDYDREELENGLYKGLISGLNDKYSEYYTKEEFEELTKDSEGVFEGIGAYLSQDPDTMIVTVVRPIPGSPAEAVGILTGDIIVEVDGEDVTGDDLNVTVAKIRGKSGTSVKIGVLREGETDVLTFDIVRASVESVTVDSKMLTDEVGYIQISEFDDVTVNQFNTALNSLKKSGMKALVIDLRDNPGGSVAAVVEIADELLPEGLVVYTEERDGTKDEYKSDAEHYLDMPIVVLANGYSASASEILIGALRDYDACTVVGTKTFGKGIVQQVLPLGDGTGMKITTSKYYTPKGNNIHGVGFEPDVLLELDYEEYKKNKVDNQLDKALELAIKEIEK